MKKTIRITVGTEPRVCKSMRYKIILYLSLKERILTYIPILPTYYTYRNTRNTLRHIVQLRANIHNKQWKNYQLQAYCNLCLNSAKIKIPAKIKYRNTYHVQLSTVFKLYTVFKYIIYTFIEVNLTGTCRIMRTLL